MNRKVNLNNLNPHLMCVLCGGYYIDATTIVECLHSFCKSCIVKHLESSKYCPICDVQIHKTKPLLNIKQDSILQDIVYKLVPGLFQNEMQNRRKFYKEHPHYLKPNDSEQSGEIYTDSYHSQTTDTICICLSYCDGAEEIEAESQKRYLRCPSGVTVQHLKKLIEAKYGLDCNVHRVDVLYEGQILNEDFSLLDISYIYLCNKKRMLYLTYRINRFKTRKRKLEEDEVDKQVEEEEVGEVEKGEDKIIVEENVAKEVVTNGEQVGPEKEDVVKDESGEEKVKSVGDEVVKEKSEEKEVQLQISENGDMLVSEVKEHTSPSVTCDVSVSSACVSVVSVPSTSASTSTTTSTVPVSAAPLPVPVSAPATAPLPPPPHKPNHVKHKTYKTVTKAPNCWHPVISREKLRPTLLKNSKTDGEQQQQQPKKPLKFFKMRDMPRFLGNPVSGVKPMYSDADKNEKSPAPPPPTTTTPAPVTESKNSIVRIDPKTLRPIEKKTDLVQKQNNLLTSPFIPNNHFLFSDVQHLPPSTTPTKDKTNSPVQQQHSPEFFKYPQNPAFFPVNDSKFNPLFRAASMSPFAGYNSAGFHSSLPPSISLLFSPHQHFKSINTHLHTHGEKKKDAGGKVNQNCDSKVKKEEPAAAAAASGTAAVAKKNGEVSEEVKRGENKQVVDEISTKTENR